MQWHRQIIDDIAGRAARIVAQRRLNLDVPCVPVTP